MNKNWSYFSIIVIIIFVNDRLAQNVSVNINIDYVTNVTKLKIYDDLSLDISRCQYLHKEGSSIYLKLSKTLITFSCTTNNTVIFNIFAYSTSISTALVTVKNSINSNNIDIISQINKKTIILNFTTEYIIFVVCSNAKSSINCLYGSIDSRLEIAGTKLEIYSACSNDRGSCLTDIEFTSKLYDFDNKGNYMGSEIIIKKSNMIPSYEPITNCRNGGIVSNSVSDQNAKCICPNTTDFLKAGRHCEVYEMSLNGATYFYVLPNTVALSIEFSLYSTAHQGLTEIFRIPGNNGQIFIRYNVSNSNHTLEVANRIGSILYPLDKGNYWLNIFLNISKMNVLFKINADETTINVDSNAFTLNLDTLPLIVNYILNTENICLANLKINTQMVDLYTPNYLNCRPDCDRCKLGEQCIYLPFKSKANSNCTCKVGLVRNEAGTCTKDSNSTVQISNNIEMVMDNTNSKKAFTDVQFRFRTLSNNGSLITFVLSNPLGFNLTIGIIDGLISTSIKNPTTSKTIIVDRIIVSDGEWHAVFVKMTEYSLEIVLDQFFSNKTFFEKAFFPNRFGNPEIRQFVLGLLTSNLPNSNNRSTCIDTITLILSGESDVINVRLNSLGLPTGCNNGTDCQPSDCTDNTKCIFKWQNNYCVCKDQFVNISGKCTFSKCVINPCSNGGSCVYDTNTNSQYRCNCYEAFSGDHCETLKFPWWIILIIILIIIIIIIILVIILVFCCCKRNVQKHVVPNIDKVHENTVCYNDQAGEIDYYGPPINFNVMKYGKDSTIPKDKDPNSSNIDLIKTKNIIDAKDDDMILDHPLEYGYEGFNSDLDSLSSLGSGSTNDGLNIQPLNKTDDKFNYLKNLYK